MIWKTLDIRPGLTCLIGGGGKTTLAHVLARQLPGTVLFCTTTRILPSETLPVVLGSEAAAAAALAAHRAVCLGTPAERGKLAAPDVPPERLCRLADYVLVEADGSRGLPLKAHLAHEPVVPAGARTILLVGASGFGQPIGRAAHRPERFAALCGAGPEGTATPERVAAVLLAEGGFDTVVVNQVDTEARRAAACRLAARLSVPVFGGEVRAGRLERLNPPDR